jgi:elongation factor Ts
MKNISAQEVKKLREATGTSILECREALEKSGGNFEKAQEYLKKRGREKAGKKSQRATYEGVVATYVHSNKKIGAMVELRTETDFVAKNSEFQDLAYDIAMHIAALAPKYLSYAEVPEKDKNEYEHLVREELAGENKPQEIIEKIVDGKVKKHFEEMSLLDQKFVKNPDISVGNLIKEKISKIGENIQVGDFKRFEI